MNYNKTKCEMHQFLNDAISKFAKKAGSKEKLSLKLGHAENYVRLILCRHKKKPNIPALESLWEECKQKIGGNK